MNASARRRTPGAPESHLGRFPATPGSRGIQRWVKDINATQLRHSVVQVPYTRLPISHPEDEKSCNWGASPSPLSAGGTQR